MAKKSPRPKLTHIDAAGNARMVEVGAKAMSARRAVATGEIHMQPATLELIRAGGAAKGDVLAVARIAGIQAAKETARWIPLCHTLALDSIHVDFEFRDARTLSARAEARTTARTGVEMEALVAVSAALLTVYDMCKGGDRGMEIEHIVLAEKEGGKSGHWRRAEDRE